MNDKRDIFVHAPLDRQAQEISLFKILRKWPECEVYSADFEVCGVIETFNLHACPDYHAISYEWGSADGCRQILINGSEFTIRRNLHDFLPALDQDVLDPYMLPSQDTYLWIDQLCIDQNDVSERNHQVSLMKAIYTTASSVVSWLGPCSDPGGYRMIDSVVEEWKAAGVSGPSVDNVRRLCRALADSSYWSRLWIVQEVLLARRLILFHGSRALPWQALAKGAANMRKNIGALVPHDANLYVLLELVECRLRAGGSVADMPLTMLQALNSFVTANSSTPHDKIYGLLGIVRSSDIEEIIIDYGQPSTTLYLQVLKLVYEKSSVRFNRAVHNVDKNSDLLFVLDVLVGAWTRQHGLQKLGPRDLLAELEKITEGPRFGQDLVVH